MQVRRLCKKNSPELKKHFTEADFDAGFDFVDKVRLLSGGAS
jgi:hypothetical protein